MHKYDIGPVPVPPHEAEANARQAIGRPARGLVFQDRRAGKRIGGATGKVLASS